MEARTASNRELARQLGVSETAVRRAEKAGRIRREVDGSWDLAKVKAAWSSNTDRAQQRRQHGAMKPVPEAAVGAVRETLREHGEPVSAGGMSFMQARTANEVLKAQERRVRLQRMKGELVGRRAGSSEICAKPHIGCAPRLTLVSLAALPLHHRRSCEHVRRRHTYRPRRPLWRGGRRQQRPRPDPRKLPREARTYRTG